MPIPADQLKHIANQCELIIREAGATIKENWYTIQNIQYKDVRDPVTEVDRNVEDFIRSKLHAVLPEAGFIVEEGITKTQDEYNWSIDPIDGTKYFIHQAPLFVSQLSLLRGDTPVLGIVYNPISDQLFSATLGNGATMNGTSLKVAERKSLAEAITDIDFGGNAHDIDFKNTIFAQFSKHCARVRVMGGAMSIYAASGVFDICVGFNHIKLVDRAPRDIILREAGMIVDYLENDRYTGIRLAAAPSLFTLAADLIQNV